MPAEPEQLDATEAETRRVIEDLIDRRARGEQVDDASVLDAHPHLGPALAEGLRRLRVVHRGRARSLELRQLEAELALPQHERDSFPGYVVLRQLGFGGQSRVMLARAAQTDELFAIKVLLDATGPDDARFRRLEREAEILSRLRHQGIVPVVEHGVSSTGRPFLVMPYIEGDDLNPGALATHADDLARLRLFIDICRAVHAAHQHDIVHRDLKPQNIRLDAAGRPHILDFGLAGPTDHASAVRSITATGEFAGTFMWSSPEQFRDADVTRASDVYSLGVILHQLLCAGRFPPQVFQNLQKQVGTAPGRLGRVRFELDTPLARACRPVLARALHEDPASRFPTAGQLADAVERAVARARTARRLGRLGMGLGAIALLAALVAGAYWLGRSDARAPENFVVNGRPRLLTPAGHFVYCPPGTFTAGSRNALPLSGRQADELPRPMTIERGFYLQATEVNQSLFESVMGTNPSRFRGADLPVDSVSYDEAVEFCRRLSARTGQTYRLPTEWEWEYACRAGADTEFSFGNDPRLMLRFGNAADASNTNPSTPGRMPYNDGHPQTSRTERFHSNAWKLHDMHGNVWEWCQGPYQIDPADPATTIAEMVPLRGGSWFDVPLPAGTRNAVTPDTRQPTVGFRLVLQDDAPERP